MMMQISSEGKKLIKQEEGYRKYAYPDPASKLAKATPGVRWGFHPAAELQATLPPTVRYLDPMPWTCGLGQTKGITVNSVMSEEQADQDLESSLPHYEAIVNNSCNRGDQSSLTQGQFDALVCLAWNCEVAVAPNSSIVKAHNRQDYAAAAKAFELYSNSKGVKNPSLLARRKREALVYLNASPIARGEPEFTNLMPQTVDPEKSLSKSKINIASATGGTVATLGAIHEVTDAIKQFQDDAVSLKNLMMPIAFIAIIVLCGVVIWQRVGLRKDGVI